MKRNRGNPKQPGLFECRLSSTISWVKRNERADAFAPAAVVAKNE
jgi:hypothetical protein